MSEGRGGVQIFCFFFLKKENRGGFYFGSFTKEHYRYFSIPLKCSFLVIPKMIESAPVI